jgi:hypothetical protein
MVIEYAGEWVPEKELTRREEGYAGVSTLRPMLDLYNSCPSVLAGHV